MLTPEKKRSIVKSIAQSVNADAAGFAAAVTAAPRRAAGSWTDRIFAPSCSRVVLLDPQHKEEQKMFPTDSDTSASFLCERSEGNDSLRIEKRFSKHTILTLKKFYNRKRC